MNNSSGVIQDLDDAALADKMRKAQERLEGLDKHVADLRSRSVEQDALAKGKLPPEQTAAYLARVKELEIKRRELLERQMGVGEELQRVATTNGTLNNHRHGGTPARRRKTPAASSSIDCVGREAACAGASGGVQGREFRRRGRGCAPHRPRPRRGGRGGGRGGARARTGRRARQKARGGTSAASSRAQATTSRPTRSARSFARRPARSLARRPARSFARRPTALPRPTPAAVSLPADSAARRRATPRRVSTGNALRLPALRDGSGHRAHESHESDESHASDGHGRLSPVRRRGRALLRHGRALRRGSFRSSRSRRRARRRSSTGTPRDARLRREAARAGGRVAEELGESSRRGETRRRRDRRWTRW